MYERLENPAEIYLIQFNNLLEGKVDLKIDKTIPLDHERDQTILC